MDLEDEVVTEEEVEAEAVIEEDEVEGVVDVVSFWFLVSSEMLNIF